VAELPVVDLEKCDGCGLCTSVCHCGVLLLVDNVITIIETTECDWCTNCEAVCPLGAIRCPYEIVLEKSRW
jgi:MinD superfamily P-loop ATPase